MVKKPMPIFGNKEDANFREAMKLYDASQYKKSLKIVDLNLKKNSNHVELLALKGCINLQLGNKDDAESYIIKATTKPGGASNYLVNHLAAIYYRQINDYPVAAKWMRALSDNGNPNKALLRDLALLQSQTREFKPLVATRQAYLEFQPGYRANWSGLAVSQHLSGDPKLAVATLTKIEGIIQEHLTDADRYEHSECLLYKNQILGEMGTVQLALDELEKDSDGITDRQSYLEYRAKYLMMLGRQKEASICYRELLMRNPDNVDWYKMLEISLGTSHGDVAVRLRLYDRLARFYPRSDPPKFIPLLFLPGDHPEFRSRVASYITAQLKRGVPSAFANVKPLYRSEKKRTVILEVVSEFFRTVDVEFKTNPTIKLWTTYFFAQHYLHLNELDKATEYIEAALKHTPTLVELYVLKARILKRQGKLLEAAQVMDNGRKLDLQDRFINSKTTKYLLRSNQVDEAIDCISLFTKLDEDAVNGCKDLHMMQNNWVLLESAEAYERLYRESKAKLEALGDDVDADEREELAETVDIYRGLAFKRYIAVVRVFEQFYIDQFDFHSYCLRRGTPRDYIDMIKWEDKLHSTPIYTRVIKGLVPMYLELNKEEKPQAGPKSTNTKQKKKRTKKRADWSSKVESEKDDKDPLGGKLLADLYEENLVEKAYELAKPITEEAQDLKVGWDLIFDIYILQAKYVLALQAARSLDRIVGREYAMTKVEALKGALAADTNVNPAIAKVVEKGIESAFK